ncbi:hypothetical protein [Staphylococcus pseudintermedius]|nr:hypothetical protein [Staphylococcus pseudintermedius]MDK4074935.1 hypothetical protein [Staphylococcus pseudintermedius]
MFKNSMDKLKRDYKSGINRYKCNPLKPIMVTVIATLLNCLYQK